MISLEVLVEEPSAKLFLETIIPGIIPADLPVQVHAFDGKSNLLKRLPQRLQGYRYYGPDVRVMILVDRDDDDCLDLKQKVEKMVADSGLTSKNVTPDGEPFQVCTRIAVEELEAWLLGDQMALMAAYPSVRVFENKAAFRDPDAVAGGTWEALERLLQRAGYYETGIAKIECASRVAQHFVPSRNRSRSFQCFLRGLIALVNGSQG